MSRRYEILITDQNGKPKVIPGANGQPPIFNGSFTSTQGGITIPGALHIDLDLPVSTYNAPIGAASLVIHGVGLPLLSQSANFNPSQYDKDPTTGFPKNYCNIQISGGMAKGLPLANPKQYGVLLNGTINQSFGNWQGTDQTLNFILQPVQGSFDIPLNFSFSCKPNQNLKEAILTTLNDAFKNFPKITIICDIDNNLVAPESLWGYWHSLTEFNTFLTEKSMSIINKSDYIGIQIKFENNVVIVYDNNTFAPQPIQLKFEDIVGQPTWLGQGQLVIKTIMRSDIRVGNKIILPYFDNIYFVNTPTYSSYQSQSAFKGTFQVSQVRHLGQFRNPSGDSWITVINAYLLTSPTGAY